MMKVEVGDENKLQQKKGISYPNQNRASSPASTLQGKLIHQELNFSSEIDKILGGVRSARTATNFNRNGNGKIQIINEKNSLQIPNGFPQIQMKSLSPKRNQQVAQLERKNTSKSKQSESNLEFKRKQLDSQQNIIQEDLQEGMNSTQSKFKQQNIEKQSNTELIKNVTNFSNVIYILGAYSNNLLDILEHHTDREKFTFELIDKMKSQEFLYAQKDRVTNIKKLFDKFFIDILLKDGQNKEVNKEITQIIGQEIQTIIQYYDKYITNQEENFRKFNMFQDKEIILITDFQDALKILMDTYNYYFKELEVYGKSKQEYNVYIKSLFQFKSVLRTDPKNEKVSKLFEELEDLLKSNFEKIDAGLIKIGKLTKENEELTKMCKDLQEQRSQFLYKMLTLQQEKQPNEIGEQGTKENPQSPTNNNIRLLEDYYTQTIENLKSENKRLNEQIQKQNKKLQLFNNVYKDGNPSSNTTNNNQNQSQNTQKDKIDSSSQAINGNNLQNKGNQDDLKNKMKQYYTSDKQVQCTFIVEKNPIQKKENDITHIIIQPIIYLKSATVQSKEWALMVTNTILSDKFLSDIQDENDLRPCIPMNIYVCEWFLKKFGNKDMAESLMKGNYFFIFLNLQQMIPKKQIFIKQDYLISLKKYGKQNERFKIFCEVCGLDELLESDSDNNAYSYNTTAYAVQIGINRQRFKKTYMRTQESVTILQKIAYLVRMTNKNYYGQNLYLPLLPNILQRCLDLVPNEYSLRIWETIAQEENLNKLDLSTLENKFKRIVIFFPIRSISNYQQQVQQDVVQRSNDPLGVYSGAQQEQEDGYIRFDTLCRCIIETMVDQRFFELEGIYSSLKLKSNPRYECLIGFQDFTKIVSKVLPKKSNRWLEVTYREFCQGVITEKTPLNVAVMRLIPFLVNDDCIKQNFLKIKPPRAIQEQPQIQQKNEKTEGQAVEGDKGGDKNQKSTTSIANNPTTKSPSRTGNSIISNIMNKPGVQNAIKSGNIGQHANTHFDPQIEQQKFKERLNALYDSVSQLGLLEETYKMMYPLIKQLEKKNQSLLTLHTSIKEDFLTLPGAIVRQIKYDQFEEKSKEDMIYAIEASWEKFRKILAFITKQ